jgi:hypothetical protein
MFSANEKLDDEKGNLHYEPTKEVAIGDFQGGSCTVRKPPKHMFIRPLSEKKKQILRN